MGSVVVALQLEAVCGPPVVQAISRPRYGVIGAASASSPASGCVTLRQHPRAAACVPRAGRAPPAAAARRARADDATGAQQAARHAAHTTSLDARVTVTSSGALFRGLLYMYR